MRPVELLAGSLVPACLPVRPAGPEACATCHGAIEPALDPSPTCAACRSVAAQLDRPLVPVIPVSLTTAGSGLHRALCRYKSLGADAGAHARHLAALLGVFVAHHVACAAPGGADAVLVVPSLGGRRPAPHPLHEVLGMVPTLPPVLDCLVQGPAPVRHRRASSLGLVCTRTLAGRRVLVVDDTYTSGAHLQSAGVAAASAGAVVVGGLVAGRFVRGGTAGEDGLLQWARNGHWVPERCARCTTE